MAQGEDGFPLESWLAECATEGNALPAHSEVRNVPGCSMES